MWPLPTMAMHIVSMPWATLDPWHAPHCAPLDGSTSRLWCQRDLSLTEPNSAAGSISVSTQLLGEPMLGNKCPSHMGRM